MIDVTEIDEIRRVAFAASRLESDITRLTGQFTDIRESWECVCQQLRDGTATARAHDPALTSIDSSFDSTIDGLTGLLAGAGLQLGLPHGRGAQPFTNGLLMSMLLNQIDPKRGVSSAMAMTAIHRARAQVRSAGAEFRAVLGEAQAALASRVRSVELHHPDLPEGTGIQIQTA